MRFMARYTLPAPIAIDKNVRRATLLHRRFSVITPYLSQPTDIREIAIQVGMQVRQLDCRLNVAPIRGTRQHCGTVDQRACKVSLFEFICQNASQRSHIVLVRSSHPHVFDLNQRRWILQLTRWANCAMRRRTQQQQGQDTFHGHSIPRAVRPQPPNIIPKVWPSLLRPLRRLGLLAEAAINCIARASTTWPAAG